jgi:DinB superfamily
VGASEGLVHPAVEPLAAIFRLNTELVLNCLTGVSEELAWQRGPAHTNSISFLLAHLIESRHLVAGLLGYPLSTPLPASVAQARTLDDAGELPPLAILEPAWERIAAHLAVHLERMDTAALRREGRHFPGSDGTLLGALAFLAEHESYHLGQIALLRRQAGLPGMRYDQRSREPGRKGA